MPRKPRPFPSMQPMMEYQPIAAADGDPPRHGVLADIGYGHSHWCDPDDPRRIVVGTPPLGDAMREVWRLPADPTEAGWDGEVGYVRGGGFLFAHLLVAEPPGEHLSEITRRAYARLIAFVRASGSPELLRVWNYLPRINDHAHGLERYQSFCKGRAQAFAAADLPPQRFPAATAIGSTGRGLSVYLLAAQQPGTPIENPRQVSAYHYPLPYGPRPPSFARAICYAGPNGSHELAISGTASIVGHLTMHPMDLRGQVEETLRNLAALMGQAQCAPSHTGTSRWLVKAYLRDPARLPEVAPVLRAWVGTQHRVMILHGAICRRALEIEIEAHRSTLVPASG